MIIVVEKGNKVKSLERSHKHQGSGGGFVAGPVLLQGALRPAGENLFVIDACFVKFIYIYTNIII